MEKNTNSDCKHTKKVWKDFEIENAGDYHDLDVFPTSLLKYMILIQLTFYQHQD